MANDNLNIVLFDHIFPLLIFGFCMIIFANGISAAAGEVISSKVLKVTGGIIILFSILLYLYGHQK